MTITSGQKSSLWIVNRENFVFGVLSSFGLYTRIERCESESKQTTNNDDGTGGGQYDKKPKNRLVITSYMPTPHPTSDMLRWDMSLKVEGVIVLEEDTFELKADMLWSENA